MTLSTYPDYENSVVDLLDKVPTRWKLKRLGDIVDFAQGKAHEPYVDADGKFICVNSRFISTQGATIKYCNLNLTPAALNDVLMVMSDLPNGRALAKAYYVSDCRDFAVNQRVCRIRPLSANSRYLFYLLDRHPLLLRNDDGFNQTHLSNSDFQKLKLYLPSSGEQTQIAHFLDHETAKIDTLIREQERLIALLKEKRQAVISHAVTKGLDPNVPMKDSGVEWLGEVPAHWETTRIGWQCIVGNGCTPSRDNSTYWDDGHYPWLNSSTVNLDRITSSEQFVTLKALKECALPIVKPGSVLMAITGEGKTRGTVSITEIEATINQHVAFISPRGSRLTPSYLHDWLSANYLRIRHASADWGSTKAAITCGDIRAYPLPLPPIDEQREICETIASKSFLFDQLVLAAQSHAGFLIERRSALISAAVTGKIDVREWQPPSHPAATEPEQEVACG